jgi:DNA-binding NarL/FixJ family response regulator
VVIVPAQLAALRGAASPWPESIQALVIDPQPLFLAALGSVLGAPPLRAKVQTAARSDDGLEIARRGDVHLVFCDIKAEPMSGRDFALALALEQPSIPVVLLGDHDDESLLAAALPSPAAGVFTKDAGVEEFIVGVTSVLAGHRAIGATLMTHLLNRLEQVPNTEPKRYEGHLSPTEIEILTMIGRAQSVPTIAARRGISRKTVRNHLAKIYRKLELHGRTEAMLWAARMGLTGDG